MVVIKKRKRSTVPSSTPSSISSSSPSHSPKPSPSPPPLTAIINIVSISIALGRPTPTPPPWPGPRRGSTSHQRRLTRGRQPRQEGGGGVKEGELQQYREEGGGGVTTAHTQQAEHSIHHRQRDRRYTKSIYRAITIVFGSVRSRPIKTQ
jgi:hypothetical protein